MRFGQYFEETASFAKPEEFAIFQRHIDPDWIEDILNASGTATIRRRRLPADQVMWLVLGIGLYRNRSIADVVSKLNLVLPGARGPEVAPSAVTQARARLGEEPLQWLFERCAQEWAHTSADQNRWRGLALYGADGSTLRVPDSEENRIYFDGPSCGEGNKSGYPVARMTVLMALRSHFLVHATFGPYFNGELTYAKNLWSHVPENSLTIVDKAYLSADILVSLSAAGNRNWLVRAKNNSNWKVIKNLGQGDNLVEMKVCLAARKQNPLLPKTWIARAITYQRKGFRPQTLLTSLLDEITYPAKETAALYHERWELEMGYDEIKTNMLLSADTLRSQNPTGVRQEIWAILIAYNLIRLEIDKIAMEANVEPTRVSFVMAMRFIQDEWLWCAIASPGAIPRHLRNLRKNVKAFILPPRRSERNYPRAVKVAKKKYPSKFVAKKQMAELK